MIVGTMGGLNARVRPEKRGKKELDWRSDRGRWSEVNSDYLSHQKGGERRKKRKGGI